MIAGATTPDRGHGAPRRQPDHGLLCPAVARHSRSGPDDHRPTAERFFRTTPWARCAPWPAPSSSRARMWTRRSGRYRAARNRAWRWPACSTIRRIPGARRATNHLDLATKEMLVEALKNFRRHDGLRIARPHVPCAVSHARPRTGGRIRHLAASHRSIRGRMWRYVERVGA